MLEPNLNHRVTSDREREAQIKIFQMREVQIDLEGNVTIIDNKTTM